MLRNSMLALAAIAALGLTATTSTDAFAKKGGWKKGGWHLKHKGGHFKHVGYGYGFRIHVPAIAPDCVQVRRYGRIRVVCYY